MNPITPDEAENHLKNKKIPNEIFEVINELIKKNYYRNEAIVYVKDIMEMLKGKFTSEQIYENHWLDIEKHYTNAGWKVTYDQPGYNESYEAFFKFKRVSTQ